MSDPTDAVVAAHAAATTARELAEQSIRDAVAAKVSIADIARALGVKNRQRIYAVLDGPDAPASAAPALSRTVFLRGAGAPQDQWDRIEQAMWRRGWVTVRDRTQAWHLARGGVPVVKVDFSSRGVDSPSYGDRLIVVAVEAKYDAEELPHLRDRTERVTRGQSVPDISDHDIVQMVSDQFGQIS